jgi:metal-dependent amidase/aminoacylase/carboxypeptidase family protein
MKTAISPTFIIPATAIFFCLTSMFASADSHDDIVQSIDQRFEGHKAIVLEIWELAELGYLEVESSTLLQKKLMDEGYSPQASAGLPTQAISIEFFQYYHLHIHSRSWKNLCFILRYQENFTRPTNTVRRYRKNVDRGLEAFREAVAAGWIGSINHPFRNS